jgi:hypothetical protein
MQKRAFSGVKVATLNSQKIDVNWITWPVYIRQLPPSGSNRSDLVNHSQLRLNRSWILVTLDCDKSSSFTWGISPVARQLVRHPENVRLCSHNKIQNPPSTWEIPKLISRNPFACKKTYAANCEPFAVDCPRQDRAQPPSGVQLGHLFPRNPLQIKITVFAQLSTVDS